MNSKKTKFPIDLNLNDIKIKCVKIDENDDYHIYVSCTAKSSICSKCGKLISKSYGQCEETVIEHLPILDNRVFIHVKWPRFKCIDCDSTTSFRPNWLNKTGQFTCKFEQNVLKNLINTTIKDISEKFNLTEEIVEGIVNRNIITDYDWGNTKVTSIGLDEIAMKKGHKQYLTVVSDLSVKGKLRVIGVIKGRTKDEINPFLKDIPDEVLFGLESICIDMSASYFPALKERINNDAFFNSVVTIDRFHVSKLVGDTVDKERKRLVNVIKKGLKDEYEKELDGIKDALIISPQNSMDKDVNNELKQRMKKIKNDYENELEKIKGTMWPFRHHPKDLEPDQVCQLNNLFDSCPKLKEVYYLREDLYNIFEKDLTKKNAKKEIDNWIDNAKCHSVFKTFTETYEKFEENILNYFTHRKSSGPVEGLNNKIKVIKRRGFGFRNIINFAKRIFLDINYKAQLINVPA